MAGNSFVGKAIPIDPVAPVEIGELDELKEFTKVVYNLNAGHGAQPKQMLYCPTCGDLRRMTLVVRYKASNSPPWLAVLMCVQCETNFTALLYDGPDKKPALAVLPSTNGGLTTPHTPGYVEPGDHVIALTSDTAILATAAVTRQMLSQLVVREIICKPAILTIGRKEEASPKMMNAAERLQIEASVTKKRKKRVTKKNVQSHA